MMTCYRVVMFLSTAFAMFASFAEWGTVEFRILWAIYALTMYIVIRDGIKDDE